MFHVKRLLIGTIMLSVVSQANATRVMVNKIKTPKTLEAFSTPAQVALLEEMERLKIAAVTKDELNTLLMHERTKQVLGIDDPALFESIISSMGAELLLSIELTSPKKMVSFVLLRPTQGKIVSRCSTPFSSAAELGANTRACVRKLFNKSASKQSYASMVDYRWLALQLGSKKAKNRAFQAVFDPLHYTIAPYDEMDEYLPLKGPLLFPGDFPGCYGRPTPTMDSFGIKDAQLGIKIPPSQADVVVKAFRENRAFLQVGFIANSAILHPMPKYVWSDCAKGLNKKFNPGKVAPHILITPQFGRLVIVAQATKKPDLSTGQSFPLLVKSNFGNISTLPSH